MDKRQLSEYEKRALEWAISQYGEEWGGNPRLARILYQRVVEGKSMQEALKDVRVINYFNEVSEEGNYMIDVIVLDVRKSVYMGCPRCRRRVDRGCVHLRQEGLSPVEIIMMPIVVTDKAGEIKEFVIYKMNGEKFEDFNVGDMLRIEFYAKTIDNEIRYYLNNYVVVRRKTQPQMPSQSNPGMGQEQHVMNQVQNTMNQSQSMMNQNTMSQSVVNQNMMNQNVMNQNIPGQYPSQPTPYMMGVNVQSGYSQNGYNQNGHSQSGMYNQSGVYAQNEVHGQNGVYAQNGTYVQNDQVDVSNNQDVHNRNSVNGSDAAGGQDDKLSVIKDVLDVVNKMENLRIEIFKKMLERKGLTLDDVRKYVILDETLDRVKFTEDGKKLLGIQ